MSEKKTVITLMCERAADVNSLLTQDGEVKDVPGLHVVKLPCSGMVQPLMIEQALKNGAEGVIVCGCQIGDCYYREGNKMIRERLLGMRPPGLKKTVDRRRVLALWLSRLQSKQFVADAKEFVVMVRDLPAAEAAKAAAPKPVLAPKTNDAEVPKTDPGAAATPKGNPGATSEAAESTMADSKPDENG